MLVWVIFESVSCDFLAAAEDSGVGVAPRLRSLDAVPPTAVVDDVLWLLATVSENTSELFKKLIEEPSAYRECRGPWASAQSLCVDPAALDARENPQAENALR